MFDSIQKSGKISASRRAASRKDSSVTQTKIIQDDLFEEPIGVLQEVWLGREA